jgi:hypothetical protein
VVETQSLQQLVKSVLYWQRLELKLFLRCPFVALEAPTIVGRRGSPTIVENQILGLDIQTKFLPLSECCCPGLKPTSTFAVPYLSSWHCSWQWWLGERNHCCLSHPWKHCVLTSPFNFTHPTFRQKKTSLMHAAARNSTPCHLSPIWRPLTDSKDNSNVVWLGRHEVGKVRQSQKFHP